MRFDDFNLVKTGHEINDIKSDLAKLKTRFSELVTCLEGREKTLLETLDNNQKADLIASDLIEKQQAAIDKLELLNCDKDKKLSGFSKWLILGVLGAMSLTVRYNASYETGTGIVITPNDESGPVLPILYGVSMVAIASGQDEKLGSVIENIGRKFSG